MPRNRPAKSRPHRITAVPDQPKPPTGGKHQKEIVVTVEEWSQPRPSRIWRDIGFAFLALAGAGAFVALALSGDVHSRSEEIWTIVISAVIGAIICFFANWDANRGRLPNLSVRREKQEPPDDGEGLVT
jgi:hypothetical protein